MVIECIFLMIKLDVIKCNLIGVIIKMFEDVGLCVVVFKCVWMSKCQVEGFYVVYKDCFFFGELVEGMILGLIVVQVLEGENVILKNCEVMGVINLVNVVEGMICKVYVLLIGENLVYGLDVLEIVVEEIVYWFLGIEIVG